MYRSHFVNKWNFKLHQRNSGKWRWHSLPFRCTLECRCQLRVSIQSWKYLHQGKEIHLRNNGPRKPFHTARTVKFPPKGNRIISYYYYLLVLEPVYTVLWILIRQRLQREEMRKLLLECHHIRWQFQSGREWLDQIVSCNIHCWKVGAVMKMFVPLGTLGVILFGNFVRWPRFNLWVNVCDKLAKQTYKSSGAGSPN